jgi:membrane protein
MRKRIAGLRTRLERLLLWRVWERMLKIEFVDRSVALAGKAFVSFFPLVIVVAAFVPQRIRSSTITGVTARLGIRGDALTIARDAFASSDDLRKATGVFGLVLTILFATSFTTALQRVYLRAWRRPPRAGVGAYWRGAAWLLVALVGLALLGGLRGALGGGFGLGLFAIVALAVTAGQWWFTAWFLLQGEVRARVLIPTGVITSIVTAGYAASATVWMPGVVTSNEAQFAFFGGRPCVGDLVLRRRDLCLDRCLRRTGLGRGHRAGRQARSRRGVSDADRRCAPVAPATRTRTRPSRRVPQHRRLVTGRAQEYPVSSWPGLMLAERAALCISAPRRLATGPEHPGAARHPDHPVVRLPLSQVVWTNAQVRAPTLTIRSTPACFER